MSIASLFNLAGPNLIVILMIVLLLHGAKGLRNLSEDVGKALSKFADEKNQFISNAELTVITVAFGVFLLIAVWSSAVR